MNTDIIYGLYYLDGDIKRYFYCGITDDFDRRFPEHQLNFNERYIKKSRAGQLKAGKYYEASQLAEYVYARTVCETVDDMHGEILAHCEDNSKYTEAWVAVLLLREGHELHQDESKLLKWERMAEDKSYKNKSAREAGLWKPPIEQVVLDGTDITLKQIEEEILFEKELMKKLKSVGWRNKKKAIGKLIFSRGKSYTNATPHYCYCETLKCEGWGMTNAEAYKNVARKIIRKVRDEQT